MLHKKNILKSKGTSILKYKGSLDFLIALFLISSLIITSIFMSHYNRDKLFCENKGISISVISTDSINKRISIVSTIKTDTTLKENMGAASSINKTFSNTEKTISLVATHHYFGQDQRSIESWDTTTERAGLALMFGRGLTMSAPEKVSVVSSCSE